MNFDCGTFFVGRLFLFVVLAIGFLLPEAAPKFYCGIGDWHWAEGGGHSVLYLRTSRAVITI